MCVTFTPVFRLAQIILIIHCNKSVTFQLKLNDELYNLRCRVKEETQLVISDCFMLIMFLEESLFQCQHFIASVMPITEEQFISTSQAFPTSEELETISLNQDQHEIALPLTKGNTAVVLGQYENHYWRLQQAYEVLS